MSDNSLAIAHTALPLSKKLKPKLQAIATAMGLDAGKTVALLRKAIQGYMSDHPEAADNPTFLPLFVHRTAPKAGGKSSTHKAVDDEAQAPAKEVTGAHKTLLDRKIAVNPPANFAKLKKQAKPEPESEDSDESDPESSSVDAKSRPASPTPKKKSAHGPVPADMVLPEMIQVKFFDERDYNAAPRQVPVPTTVKQCTGVQP
ncbi:hypothetical protein C8F04DRAFT_1281493 [Mycena alexandri]|uniref:Uncharacterized protein n=1 Tax=Mycena alexandri TaxID=1745969 RepID=A0AAD6WL79_9AGAR|nr:hypothetical protein C8F04DRAFT_1281493 [Mycena alexandri]